MRNTELFRRVSGCMVAGAVGDAMGFATEGMHYRAIARRFGKVDKPMVRNGGAAMRPPVTSHVYTDDTVMKHMVCESIFESNGHPTIEAVANVWRRHITDFDSWVWWNNTRVVAMKLSMNPLLPLREVGRDSIACNDAAMIIGPVGLLNVGDPMRAATEAWDISGLWQNGYSRECAASIAAAHAAALAPGATIGKVIDTAKRFGPTLAPYMDRAMALVSQCHGAEEFTQRFYAEQICFPNETFWTPPNHPDPDWSFGADPLEVCTEALAFMALADGDPREAILGAINFGRDCDTIAGIAAALTCAINGSEGLPLEWVETIKRDNPAPDMLQYAQQLCELISENAAAMELQVTEIRSLLV